MSSLPTSLRPEQEVFNDLAALCTSPGYAHAICLLVLRDNFLDVDEADALSARERLLRTEIATLVGLMVKGPIDYSLPSQATIYDYIGRTQELLEELHQCMEADAWGGPPDPSKGIDLARENESSGSSIRESVFYGRPSAYDFQYEDLSPRKYGADNDWLVRNKGFTIQEAQATIGAISRHVNEQLGVVYEAMCNVEPEARTVLPGFAFKPDDLAQRAELPIDTINKVLDAFTVPAGEGNSGFKTVSDFNIAASHPLLRMPDGRFLIFHPSTIFEALYESPNYWLLQDISYGPTLNENRGDFAEMFSTERLKLVFGAKHVFPNVKFWKKGERNERGEIDTLVLFGNRALVVQVKTKRMTLEARKGNDQRIQKDFQDSIQRACNQAHSGSDALRSSDFVFKTADGNVLPIPPLRAIYPLCVVADHYPALNFQSRQFLKFEHDEIIKPPFVMDVFTLDAMTEFLQSPLRLLSYIARRAEYYDSIISEHELTVLAFHLRSNLWQDGSFDTILLANEIDEDLDEAMAVRRRGFPGKATPEGILTRMAGTVMMKLVEQIEEVPHPATIDLGFQLLQFGEQTVVRFSNRIESQAREVLADKKRRDFALPFPGFGSGLTVHLNDDPNDDAVKHLKVMMELRKYQQKANTWYGILVSPSTLRLRTALIYEVPWEQDPDMDRAMEHFTQNLGEL